MRVLSIEDPLRGSLVPLHRFQDTINRTSWNAVGFSGDGEYVMGGEERVFVFVGDKTFSLMSF